MLDYRPTNRLRPQPSLLHFTRNRGCCNKECVNPKHRECAFCHQPYCRTHYDNHWHYCPPRAR